MIPLPQKKKKPRYSVWRLYRGFVFEYIVEVFTKSSAHGYFQLAQKNRHPSETIMWTLAIVCAICTAIYAGMTTLFRHWMSPTVISVERDYYSWNSSFPSVTICPHDKIDEILLQQYINNSMASNKTELEIFLRNLANAKFDSFEDVPLYPGISSNDYLKILLEITSTMEHTITTADGRELTFQKTVTEMGICFTINSLISDYQSPEYILNPTNRHKGITQRPLYTVHALDGEVFAQVLEIEAGFDVFVHSPFEIAGMRKIMRCDTSFYCFLELQSLPIICTDRAKDMYISQRKCRFTDEPFQGRFNIYSYNLCRMEARAQICKRICNCVPYFIPKLEGERVCDVNGMHCIARNFAKITAISSKDADSQACVQNCEDTHFTKHKEKAIQWFKGTNFRWELVRTPRMRLKRDVIYGQNDLLTSWGGIAGFFLGCSVMSFIEILYFNTLKLYFDFQKYKKHMYYAP